MKTRIKQFLTISFVAHPSLIVDCLHCVQEFMDPGLTHGPFTRKNLADRTGRNMSLQQC
jgi:hypothetical protein